MKKILTLLVLTLSFGNVHAQNTNKLKKELLSSIELSSSFFNLFTLCALILPIESINIRIGR